MAETKGPDRGPAGAEDSQWTIATPPAGESRAAPPAEVPHIEGYQITGRLGEGGMGVVWRAVQLSTRREVALKVLPAGQFASGKARARFEREVELAARLEHPHIARVYDSGLLHHACYYAMELVEGVALDQYVQARKLSQREILELGRTICQAVQYAHQRGIIHRDLKPSNILVSADGQPHVLDFGLAKAFGEEDREVTLSTDGAISGTPAYMAPEQAAGKVEQIDTRSDVYSLGVVLYRLLTGRNPHDLTGTHLEVLRRVAEEEVARPRLASGLIDKELEALLLKALAHEADRRYSTAGELAEDLGRYLRGDPLLARPPTTMYFLRKKVRKYRLPVALVSLAALALLGLAVYAYVRIGAERNAAVAQGQRAEAEKVRADQQKDKAVEMGSLALKRLAETEAEKKRTEEQKAKAEKEAEKAKAVTKFLTDMVEKAKVHRTTGGKEITLREVLVEAAKDTGIEFQDKPETEAAIRYALGKALDFELGEENLRIALRLQESTLGAEHADTLATAFALAQILHRNVATANEAERIYRKLLERSPRVLDPNNPMVEASRLGLEVALGNQNKENRQADLARHDAEKCERELGKEHADTLNAWGNWAQLIALKPGRYAEAEKVLKEQIEISRRARGITYPTGRLIKYLGDVFIEQKKYEEAETLLQKAVAETGIMGPDPNCWTDQGVFECLNTLAFLFRAQERFAEAEPLYRRVLDASKALQGNASFNARWAAMELGQVLGRLKKFPEAEKILRETADWGRRELKQGDTHLTTVLGSLAEVLDAQGKNAEAEQIRAEVKRGADQAASQPAPDTDAATTAPAKKGIN